MTNVNIYDNIITNAVSSGLLLLSTVTTMIAVSCIGINTICIAIIVAMAILLLLLLLHCEY